MGVTSLWSVLEPSRRYVALATLNRKRLAIDASIWVYQFLKAVRDKEGNALRNAHIVGFFRRICKLLFHGILPVFVFDGGAPILKRQTIQGRKSRREGRREDAVRTAGKLLAVQMKRRGEEEEDKRKKDAKREREGLPRDEEEEAIPEGHDMVYAEELGMSAQERARTRTFRKTDAYHLPELAGGIEGMGQPNDPRIMSAAELEDYARQFHNGEDVNIYDFSKIDFESDFFKSLPAGDRYNILNAARLRSRMRMGLGKEQLEEMFPDRMAFSRFQIARVAERNELTQRLMNLNGMNDLPGVGGGRIAGERGREYILVKNDGVEGGWALGVVSTEKGVGERDKPIDVDAFHHKAKEEEDSEEEEEFEDVPVEGLNRLPKTLVRNRQNLSYEEYQTQEIEDHKARSLAQIRGKTLRNSQDAAETDATIYNGSARAPSEDPGSLFVTEDPIAESSAHARLSLEDDDDELNQAIALSLQHDENADDADEDEHVNQAIAMSLKKNHALQSEPEDDDVEFEDVPLPAYKQRAVQSSNPISGSSGGMIAHIVNNRANAAIVKPKAVEVDSDSDSDLDMQAALAKARKQKAPAKRQPAPVASNTKNLFDGPLPFEKLGSIFGKKGKQSSQPAADGEDDDDAGGFEKDSGKEAPRPLPPWLAGGDIRHEVEEQRKRDQELNAEDRERADEEERLFRKENDPIQIDSSDEESDVEVVDVSTFQPRPKKMDDLAEDIRADPPVSDIPNNRQPSVEPVTEQDEEVEWSESDYGDTTKSVKRGVDASHPAGGRTDIVASKSASVEPEFEDVEMPQPKSPSKQGSPAGRTPSPLFEDVDMTDPAAAFPSNGASLAAPVPHADDEYIREQAELDAEFDLSDPEDEDFYVRMAVEAEEHARFASTLNQKTPQENKKSYDDELKALRNQQKKDRRDADEVTQVMITECQALVRLFGLPYVTAPMEAEAQCAELVRLGLVDGVVTDDCDVFLFGGTRVYKNMFNSNKDVECYLAADIEKELSLSRDQLIAIAHMLGSDYTEGLPGIGPITAVEILSEFPSASGLEDFKEWWTRVQLSPAPLNTEISTFRKKFRRSQATKLFLPPTFPSQAVTQAYLKPDVDSTPEPFQWGVPDLDQLREFLMATIGWSPERTDEILVPVIRDMNRRATEGTQSNITRYFYGAVGVGVGGSIGAKEGGSKRMREAVGKLKAKKKSAANPLGQTYGEAAQEWAKHNDLGWTEKEQEKLWGKGGKKGKGRGKAKKRVVEAEDETEDSDDAGEKEESSHDADEEADEATTGRGSEKRPRGTGKGREPNPKRAKLASST